MVLPLLAVVVGHLPLRLPLLLLRLLAVVDVLLRLHRLVGVAVPVVLDRHLHYFPPPHRQRLPLQLLAVDVGNQYYQYYHYYSVPVVVAVPLLLQLLAVPVVFVSSFLLAVDESMLNQFEYY